MNPTIFSALIAGTVSIIISSISLIYSMYQNKKHLDKLKAELLMKSNVESFLVAKELYLNAYKDFEKELISINDHNPEDGTHAVQFAINFYGDKAKDFYLRNRSILKTNSLDSQLSKITLTVQSQKLSNPNNVSIRRQFAYDIINFCSDLNDQSLKS